MTARRDANHGATRERKRTMPDETNFELASATNLLAYESGVSRHRRCGRFGLMVLGRTMLVGLGVALPYWSALDRWFTLTL